MKNNCSPKNYLKSEDDYGFFCIIDRDDIEIKTDTISQNSTKKTLKKKYIDYINEKWNKECKKYLENKNTDKNANNYFEYCKINNVENNNDCIINRLDDRDDGDYDDDDDDDDDDYKRNSEKIKLFIRRMVFTSFVLLVGLLYFITAKYYCKK
jgi:hypothetical protein